MLKPPQQDSADLDAITHILTGSADPEAAVQTLKDKTAEQDTETQEEPEDHGQADEAVQQVMEEQLFEEQIQDVEQHEDRIIDTALESGELQDTVFPDKRITFERAPVPTILAEKGRPAAATQPCPQEETEAAEPETEKQEILNRQYTDPFTKEYRTIMNNRMGFEQY